MRCGPQRIFIDNIAGPFLSAVAEHHVPAVRPLLDQVGPVASLPAATLCVGAQSLDARDPPQMEANRRRWERTTDRQLLELVQFRREAPRRAESAA